MGKVIMTGGAPKIKGLVEKIRAGTLAVGSSVFLNENGRPAEYLVVHQGKPSTMYDNSCDGTWLWRKDAFTVTWWDSNNNYYRESDIHTYLNNRFMDVFDDDTLGIIKQVKIPSATSAGTSSIGAGANGLSTKAFLLGLAEAGYAASVSNYMQVDGTCLEYFSESAQDKRIVCLNGNAVSWWTRSATTLNMQNAHYFYSNGGVANAIYSTANCVVPAIIIEPDAVFAADTLILVGAG